MAKDMPTTGDGRTSGRKPARQQVAAKTSGGATLWDQTVAFFTKPKPKVAPVVRKAKKKK